MKKQLVIFFLALLIITPTIKDIAATTVFLTSDNLVDSHTDIEILNSIKDNIEKISDGKIKVTIDPDAPGPGEGTRAIQSNSDVSVNLASSCAGNFLVLAKYAEHTDKQIIFVNTGDFDLNQENSLRRAWDDDYSKTNFAGINSPGEFLNQSGISYIQPLQKYPDCGPDGYLNKNNENVNKYIAKSIIEDINNHQNNSKKNINENLIITHKIPPSTMAQASSQYLENNENKTNFNNYNAAQLLYLTSSYLNGNALKNPENYNEPSSPLKYSLFTQDTYSIYDYIKMGGIVKNYMDENGKAPNYIHYNGAYISYYDLQYNFAKITENHTDSNHMNFHNQYTFEKTNQSILIDLLPIIIICLIIISIIIIIKKIKT